MVRLINKYGGDPVVISLAKAESILRDNYPRGGRVAFQTLLGFGECVWLMGTMKLLK